jgi:hypothetical protein
MTRRAKSRLDEADAAPAIRRLRESGIPGLQGGFFRWFLIP